MLKPFSNPSLIVDWKETNKVYKMYRSNNGNNLIFLLNKSEIIKFDLESTNKIKSHLESTSKIFIICENEENFTIMNIFAILKATNLITSHWQLASNLDLIYHNDKIIKIFMNKFWYEEFIF